ncbi:MAG TPA: putative toxin-antitoxin system toxin component, PIN family [Bacteroidales bacterium]|nr:putative toxin-antitoxin system toxin component, PIN family [Bacteroidales bacterium]
MPRRKKIRIVIDTNLFISFLIGKRIKGLKKSLVQSTVQLIFSEQNIEELKIVTRRPKFEKYFDKNDVDDLIDLIYAIGIIEKIIDEPEICRDPKDNFLLALSDKGKADYLTTGDSDLLTIGEYKKTKIITIDQLEKIVNESTRS